MVRHMTPKLAYITIGSRMLSEAWATLRQMVPIEERTGPNPGIWSFVQPVSLEYQLVSIRILFSQRVTSFP